MIFFITGYLGGKMLDNTDQKINLCIEGDKYVMISLWKENGVSQ